MRKNAIAVFAALAAAVFCASAVEVRDFGAVGDGVADDTAAIQRAIDAGGIVHFPPGVYLSGSLYLKSGGGLRLDDNAVLKGHPDISKCPTRPICGEPSATQPADVEIATVCAVTNRHHGWPTVARRSNGELIVAFSGDRRAHVCPYGKIQIVRSSDDGKTWSAPETIYSSDTVDCRDAGVVELADGTLVVNFFTSIAYGRVKRGGYERIFKEKDKANIAEELGYWSMRSTDGGKTWADKVRMASSSPHNVIQLRDGRLAALGTRNIGWQWAYMPPEFASLGKELLFESSADGGKSWKSVVPVPVPSGVDAGLLYEPHVVELADGTLVGLVRYCVKPERSLQTESRDGGKTWTPLHENGANGIPPHLAHLADGRVLLTYAKRDGKTGGVYAAFSGDGARTPWTGERLLFPWYQWDFGYPSSVQLGDGSVLTVFYAPEKAGGSCVIKSARWKPEMK